MKNDEWREKYLIGITEIDDDHQHLFDVIAMEVSELILNKDKVQTYFSTKNIDDLLTKIKQHYHNEELWMKGHQYPHIKKHQEQHSNSVEEIENGFITTKSWDIKYEIKKEGEDDTRTDYVYFSKKWYTKEDPLVLKVTNKSLADAFTED